MSCKIITINREFESEGSEIAQEVAKRLNLPYYDKFLITASAEQSGISLHNAERTDEQLESRFEYSRAAATYQYSGGESPLPTGARVAQAQFDLIRQLADEGPCVIVGRCAGYILRARGCAERVHPCRYGIPHPSGHEQAVSLRTRSRARSEADRQSP